MDARPILFTLARGLEEEGLEAVMIGNAAAALHGAPVTTLDFDFLFRKTPGNLRKLKAVAKSLGAMLLRPCYPASDLFRICETASAGCCGNRPGNALTSCASASGSTPPACKKKPPRLSDRARTLQAPAGPYRDPAHPAIPR